MPDNHVHPHCQVQVLTIDGLTNDDLLAIFDFCVIGYQDLISLVFCSYDTKRKIESWQTLVHVCRRWRDLVFRSPRRLNLQLYYNYRTVKTLDVWPAFPLVIIDELPEGSVDDHAAGLEHGDRISQINLYRETLLEFDTTLTIMKVPFPELTVLRLQYDGWSMPLLPDSFLGGSAPRLQYIYLDSIVIPGLPKLLLSATQLHHLHLCNIPYSAQYSPETMANCLSMLTSLEDLHLEFESPEDFPESRRSFPITRSVLPNLTKVWLQGAAEHLEDFLVRIDAPQLHQMSITSKHLEKFEFKIPELTQFISRTPTLGGYDEARLILDHYEPVLRLRQSHPGLSDHRMVEVKILPYGMKWPFSTMQIYILSLHVLLTMENLYIETNDYSMSAKRCNIGNRNTKWLDPFLPFSTPVKNLYLSKLVSSLRILDPLQELTGGRTTEMLPALQNIFLEGFEPSVPVEEVIAQFISARQLTNHPVAISVWNR